MNTEQTDKAIAIVNYLVQRGHFVDFDARTSMVAINPTPTKAIVDRVMANEAILTELLAALDARPATNHLFVITSEPFAEGAIRVPPPEYAMCIACGVPWVCHGEPPRERWSIATDVELVQIRDCAPLPVRCECGVVAA